jgi:uncharacterized OB-fold protein
LSGFAPRTLADLAAPFFDAAARAELVVPRCDNCSRYFFYATVLCQHCHSPKWSWTRSSGLGTVYARTVVHRPLQPELEAPYVVAVIELDEGVRLMTNIVEVDPHQVAIGQRVEAVFGDSWNGRAVPFFRPTAENG